VRVGKEATDAQHIHFSYSGAACGSAVSTVDSVSAVKQKLEVSEARRGGLARVPSTVPAGGFDDHLAASDHRQAQDRALSWIEALPISGRVREPV